MRPLLLTLTALLFSACHPHAEITRVQLTKQSPFHIIQIDSRFMYLIDPRTETCFLLAGGSEAFGMTHVPCDKLKRNVPEAVPFLAWVADAPAAPAPAY
ncbi:hypothetical protein [Myxococcus qinghaiensis]|uniref:hypothetical protein n=1 Tax=Myxococcus qinghaiensis TaxID=2906758 RepID=UPI0020A76845|nr:hypothetical protein [Myxococcus qinghaiensis]MCP3167787.1 hypothetical protein [Myxococcus qinghaiensis]